VQAGAVLALLAVVLASAGVTKPTLTVAVSGNGSVASRPAGISCKPSCKLRARKGAKVTLTASPNQGAEFSHWSAPCGTSYVCTVKMTKSRFVTAFFKKAPPPLPAPLPPPLPAPPAKAGHYVGTYTDGTFMRFDVNGSIASNFNFDFNGECPNGSTTYDTGFVVSGPFVLASDGSFSAVTTTTFSNSAVTVTLAGTATPAGTASGTLNISIAFNGGDTCTSKGTWSAQDQS
jgi:hypothetical protein